MIRESIKPASNGPELDELGISAPAMELKNRCGCRTIYIIDLGANVSLEQLVAIKIVFALTPDQAQMGKIIPKKL